MNEIVIVNPKYEIHAKQIDRLIDKFEDTVRAEEMAGSMTPDGANLARLEYREAKMSLRNAMRSLLNMVSSE